MLSMLVSVIGFLIGNNSGISMFDVFQRPSCTGLHLYAEFVPDKSSTLTLSKPDLVKAWPKLLDIEAKGVAKTAGSSSSSATTTFGNNALLGTVISPEEAKSIRVSGFPLIGSHKITKVDEKSVTMKPACYISSTDFDETWSPVLLSDLPEGIRTWMKQRGREREIPVHGSLTVESLGKITAIAPELFQIAEIGGEVAIVTVEPKTTWESLRGLLNAKVKVLGEGSRFVVMGFLTLSGILALGGAAGGADA
ncbi:unnamed protein product [Amoebophrya sp. A120]|nr:unnamed protein product [Amoebophrya sp. A120]|eukprot:GSA120T00012845001.1